MGGIHTHLCDSATHSLPPSHQTTATLPPFVFVPPCCQYIAVLGTSGLCVLESIDKTGVMYVNLLLSQVMRVHGRLGW